jgi:type III secretion protein U
LSGDKTEQPTSKRTREAIEKGDVVKSQDVAPALTVLALTLYLAFGWSHISGEILDMTDGVFALMALPPGEAVRLASRLVIAASARVVAPALALVISVGLLGTVAQVGIIVAAKAALPKLENLDPAKWFKKTFSLKNAADLLKNVLKVLILGFAAWRIIKGAMSALLMIPGGDAASLWTVLYGSVTTLAVHVSVCFCVLAGLDYMFQRWRYNKDHMMSKDEVKREYKEMEGDPQMKHRRRQLHRELSAQNTLAYVRKAKVLITNPTHYAVALDYEKDKTPLPVILAKGEGSLARRMIETAKQEGIPIMRNVQLARDLFSQGTEMSYIPSELIGPVAEVLRWLQSLERR